MRWVAGVDGCPGGWIVVLRCEDPRMAARVSVIADLAPLLGSPDAPAVMAIDMPIGLPERIGPGGRGPERLLRPHLGQRQSSVFSVPSRGAVYAGDYGAACRIAAGTSDPPRKISKQAFGLFPKIRALDALLRADPTLLSRVVECHPEGAFVVMNGGMPLSEPKKVKSRPYPPGLDQRRTLLATHGVGPEVLAMTPPRGAALDDLLDACACSVTALRVLRGEAISRPDPPDRDGYGLPIAIWS